MVKEELDDLKDLDGNLFEVLDKALVFLKEHLRLSARIEGLQRKERWEIPVDALREAIINALIHRDYSSPSFVYIKIYDEKIVIANPGSLPDGMKIEDLYREHESRPGNQLPGFSIMRAILRSGGAGFSISFNGLRRESSPSLCLNNLEALSGWFSGE